jgi:hypothetical protein
MLRTSARNVVRVEYARVIIHGFESAEDCLLVHSASLVTPPLVNYNNEMADTREEDEIISLSGEDVHVEDVGALKQHAIALQTRKNQLRAKRERTQLLGEIAKLQRDVAELELAQSSVSETGRKRASGPSASMASSGQKEAQKVPKVKTATHMSGERYWTITCLGCDMWNWVRRRGVMTAVLWRRRS